MHSTSNVVVVIYCFNRKSSVFTRLVSSFPEKKMTSEVKRSLQQVVPLRNRVRCTEWMEIDKAFHGRKGLVGRTVKKTISALFRSVDRVVSMNWDWWNKRKDTAARLADPKQQKYATGSQWNRHQFAVKAFSGRGQKLGEHWQWLYPRLLAEFQRLRHAGCKMFTSLVIDIGKVLIDDSHHLVYNPRFSLNSKPFTSMVTKRRVRDFLERYNIVYRRHKRKKQVHEAKQMQVDRSIAVHLGKLKRQFEEGTLNPEHQYNMDESHFVIGLDGGKTLDFVGSESVKYRSIVSGREGITMCVLVKGGSDARLLCPMFIIKNKNSSYPIKGLQDNVKGVCYRSSPSAFINGRIMKEWLEEPRCWGPGGPFAAARTLWMDNASGHCGEDVEKLHAVCERV